MPSTMRAPSSTAARAPQIEPPIAPGALEGSARESLADIQRSRILAAMVEVASQQGFVDATIARVVTRAGVSRRTFYELFDNREECFLAALDTAIEHTTRAALTEYNPTASWITRIRDAVSGLLAFLDAEPDMGRLLVVASLGAGTEALERRQRVLERAIAIVEEGRTQTKAGADPAPLTAEGVVGGALSVIHARMTAREEKPLSELTGPLVSMIVAPYLGPAAARRELTRAPAKSQTPHARAGTGGDPLRGLEMRLTYRTVRVLLSVAAAPGSSNREIGSAAGMSDQGQTSKLLTRLRRLGLIEQVGSTPAKGAPNAWTLTERGEAIQATLAVTQAGR